jgi:hypothetical protein
MVHLEPAKEEMIDCLFSQTCPLTAKEEAAFVMLAGSKDVCEKEIWPRRLASDNLDAGSFLVIYQACNFTLTPADLRLLAFFLNDYNADTHLLVLRFLAAKAPESGLRSAVVEMSKGRQSEAVSILAWLYGRGFYLKQGEMEDVFSRCLVSNLTEDNLRRFIFLAGDYLTLYPDASSSFLRAIISGDYGQVERALAADILKKGGYETSEIIINEDDL